MIRQFLRYCLVGLANTAIGLSMIYAGMAILHLPPGIANALGFAIGFSVSYLLNRIYTFKSQAPAKRSLLIFGAVVAVGYTANLAVVLAAVHQAGINPYLAQLAGVCVYAGIVFFGARYAAFRN